MVGLDPREGQLNDDDARAAIDTQLPRRRCSAGVLLRDARGAILLVKPAYRPEWMIPGGVVEAGETPAQAAIREVREETGLDVQLTGLLCVDMVNAQDGFSESIHFLFAARTRQQDQHLRADGVEVLQVRFTETETALTLLPAATARRVREALSASVGYYECGQLALPFSTGYLP